MTKDKVLRNNRVYKILYLTPNAILEKSKFLKLQRKYIETYIEKLVLPTLQDPKKVDKLKDNLTEFEKILSGLINTLNAPEHDVLGKVAFVWYVFTKTSHASLGPRVGNFTEQVIKLWIEDRGKHNRKVSVETNVSIAEYFNKHFGTSLRGRRRIDFIINDKSRRTLSLIELRISEHTGGKTGQESLMDKLTEVLSWLEGNVELRKRLKRKGYNRLELAIAILFAEKGHKLLSRDNYSEGRFTSLRDYILDRRHIGGRLEELINKFGYEISLDGGYNYVKLKYNEKTKNLVDKALKNHRRIYLRKDDFTVELSILWGDEFFIKYVGKSFYELLIEAEYEIADDVWLFFTITINETKILKEYGFTYLEKVYEFLVKNKILLDKFNDLYKRYEYESCKSSDNTILIRYFSELDELLDVYVNQFIKHARDSKLELRLLETNDFLKQYNYLKQLCIVALAMYVWKSYRHAKQIIRNFVI